MNRLSDTLIAELGKLDRSQLLHLLGEIVEPSIHTPFAADAQTDDFLEELEPVTAAYRAAYARLAWQDEDDDRWVFVERAPQIAYIPRAPSVRSLNERYWELIEGEHAGALTDVETAELDALCSQLGDEAA